MKKLLELNPYVVVQMTLLDPFIPGSVLPFTHGQNNNVMAASQYLASSDRIHRLESYFANDSPLDGSNPFFGDSPTLGTQDTFVWRSGIDINQQVDWGVSPGLGHRWYDHHGGPTEFYADNVKASIPGETVEPGQYGLLCPFDYENTGFRKSLFYEAYLRPQIGSQPQSQSGSQGTTVNMTISGQRINNVAWFKVGSSQVVGSGASLPVVIGSNTVGDYVARVSNQYGLLFSTNASVSLSGSPPPPAAPTITTVLPNPLAPSPALKTIRIIGSGYTGSSTLLLNGNIPSVPARLTLVNVNEINYSHNFETSGDWTVVVVNGGQQSNVKHFTVQAPLVSSGSLSVRLSAQGGGIPAGAQWRVDGDPNFHNSDDPSISLTPGLHTVSFKPVAGYTTPLDQPVSVAANMQTTAYGVYTPVTATTYTLNINTDVSKGSVYRNPNRNTFSPGETVRLTADYAPGDFVRLTRGEMLVFEGRNLVGAPKGQEFPLLKPKESAEVFVASEEQPLGKITGPMVWRLKVRKALTVAGHGAATVIGVPFAKSDIAMKAKEDVSRLSDG